MNSHAYWTCLCLCVFYCIKVSKGANIRNRYNQVPNVLFVVIGLCFVIVHFPLVFDCFISLSACEYNVLFSILFESMLIKQVLIKLNGICYTN